MNRPLAGRVPCSIHPLGRRVVSGAALSAREPVVPGVATLRPLEDDVPLFEIHLAELVPFRRLKGGSDLYEKEIESLLWSNLEEFTGEALFPIARQAKLPLGGIPDIVALEKTGRVLWCSRSSAISIGDNSPSALSTPAGPEPPVSTRLRASTTEGHQRSGLIGRSSQTPIRRCWSIHTPSLFWLPATSRNAPSPHSSSSARMAFQ